MTLSEELGAGSDGSPFDTLYDSSVVCFVMATADFKLAARDSDIVMELAGEATSLALSPRATPKFLVWSAKMDEDCLLS